TKAVPVWQLLGAVEDDERDLARGQALLLIEIGDHLLEMVTLVRASGSGADFELVPANLERRDRARLQVLVPRRVRGRAIARGDHYVPIPILAKAQDGRPLLARLGTGGG